MKKLDNMHYLFNKFHSSDVFVMTSCEYFQTLKTSEQYVWLWKLSILEYKWALLIYINEHLENFFNVNVFMSSSGFTSHLTSISVKNSITTGWLRIVPIIRQLDFYKFQVVMSSKKNTFMLLLIFSVKVLQ